MIVTLVGAKRVRLGWLVGPKRMSTVCLSIWYYQFKFPWSMHIACCLIFPGCSTVVNEMLEWCTWGKCEDMDIVGVQQFCICIDLTLSSPCCQIKTQTYMCWLWWMWIFFYLATIISTMLVMSVLVMPAMSCAAIEDYFLWNATINDGLRTHWGLRPLLGF